MKYIRYILLLILKPFLKLASVVHVPYSRPIIPYDQVRQGKGCLLVGDILLSATAGEATNLFEPFAKYRHVAVFLGSGFVIEATGKGVKLKHLDQYFWEKNRICVRRTLRNPLKGTLRQFAYKQVGKLYDYGFLKGAASWYCSELGYSILNEAIEDWGFKPRKIWGEMTITPMDFYHADKHFRTIWEFAG